MTLVTKTSTAYTGIVRGSSSAVYTLVQETKNLCDVIERSVGAGKNG